MGDGQGGATKAPCSPSRWGRMGGVDRKLDGACTPSTSSQGLQCTWPRGGPALGRAERQKGAAWDEAGLLTGSCPLLPQPSQLLCLQAQPHSHDPQPVGGTALPQWQPQPAGCSSSRTGPARRWPLHSVRGGVLRTARPTTPTLSPALAPARDGQKPDGALPPDSGEAVWTGPLLADTVS